MGYYTYFKITADDDCEDEYIEELKKISGYNHEIGECIKWYNYNEDMLALSRKYPDVTFRVDGEGESSADIWVRWYRNGETRAWGLDIIIPEGFTPPEPW